MERIKAFLKKHEGLIEWLMVMASAPVAIGLLARWHDEAPLLFVPACIIAHNAKNIIAWLDKRVGPTDF